MTIILFLVDTSASMSQRTYLGARLSVLDVAKDAVERFLKMRQKDQASRQDRYMLLTFEESPANIKAGWKENHMTFMSELKNLQATGLTSMGGALKNAFDLLNMNRMQTGIDTYGQGRCPFYLEPSMIVVLTDGNKLTSQSGVLDQLNLPMHSLVPGSELTKEPFRWDQRIFSLVLRMAGTIAPIVGGDGVPPPDIGNPVNDMCEVTGGRSYSVSTQRQLLMAIENLVQSVQPGVVIHFEKSGPDPFPVGQSIDNDEILLRNGVTNRPSPTPFGSSNNSQNNSTSGLTASSQLLSAEIKGWQTCRKLIYVQRSAVKGYSVGHWPIPESFWPDHNSPALPPRTAHPVVRFSCVDAEPMVIESLPFDKYELEPSPLTQFILARKQPTVAWQVYVANSHKSSDLGFPFGYLKASTTLTCVNLFVMPYNYPVLLMLLEELFKVHRLKAPPEWRDKFQDYLHNMPVYYAGPLKRALQRMGAPNLVPEHLESQCLNATVVSQLKKLKNQAKAEFEKLCSLVGNAKRPVTESMRVLPGLTRPSGETPKLTELKLTYSPALKDRFLSIRSELNDFGNFQLAVQKISGRRGGPQGDMFRNPFEIPRCHLLNQIWRMRANLLHLGTIRLQDDDALHSLSIVQMGNYQEHLKRQTPPLREIESTPVRQHMFGNPFKIDKRMMVDEADAPDTVGLANSTSGSGFVMNRKRPADSSSATSQGRPKRQKGPLPRDLVLRPRSPSISPIASPCSSPNSSPCPSPVPHQIPTVVSLVSAQAEMSPAASVSPVQASAVATAAPAAAAPATAAATATAAVSTAVSTAATAVATAAATSIISTTSTTVFVPACVNVPNATLSVPTSSPAQDFNGDSKPANNVNNNVLKPEVLHIETNGCTVFSSIGALTPGPVPVASPAAITVVSSQHPLMQLVHNNPNLGPGQGVALSALGGELNAPSSLQQAPANGNVAPFSRCKPKGKLLNGFSEEPKKEIIVMSREECEKLTKTAIRCVRRPGKDFTELFTLLSDAKSQPAFPSLVQRLILEANRFKRKHLADLLAKQLQPPQMMMMIQPSNNGCSQWKKASQVKR